MIKAMNTSAMNQTPDTTTSIARTTGLLRRGMAGALLAAAFAATAAGFAATAHADDSPPVPTTANCKTEPWGFLGSQRRTLCDGPISSDGSWSRERTIWRPAHYSTPICTSRGGSSSYSSYTDCSGGYFVNQSVVSNETYPVRPDTVLPDEPGHLG
jgi:hypothetical protein